MKILKGLHPIDTAEVPGAWTFICPGCKMFHTVWTSEAGRSESHTWTFNGNEESPTIRASVLVTSQYICHSYVTDGKIEFLNDSNHYLAGKTVELPEIIRGQYKQLENIKVVEC